MLMFQVISLFLLLLPIFGDAKPSQGIVSQDNDLMPPEIVEVVPLVKLTPAQTLVTRNPMDCLICKQVARWVMTKLKDNKTEISVVQALDEVCDKIFTKGKAFDCKEFVSRYTHEMIQFIIQEDDPKTVCRLLNVCTSWISEETTLKDKTCSSCLTNTDSFRRLLPFNHNLNLSSTTPLLLIYLCESAGLDEDCVTFMERNRPFMSVFLREERTSREVCDAINLCEQQTLQEVVIEPETEVEEVQLLPTCFVCKRIVKWVNHQIKDNRTEAAIEDALEDVCKFVKDVDNCHLRIAAWSQKLVQVMKTATDTDLTCELMGACGLVLPSIEREEEEESIMSTTPPTEQGACHECQNFAHFIQTELYDYNKEKEVDDFLIERICDKIIQEAVKDTCKSFINEYGPSIMQQIAVKAFDPKKLCERELRLCPPSSVPEQQTDFEIIRPASERTCDTCVEVVKELDSLLAVEKIDKDISKVAARICSRVPSDRQKQVRNLRKTTQDNSGFFLSTS